MKKTVKVLLAALMLTLALSMAACTPTTPTETTAVTETPPAE